MQLLNRRISLYLEKMKGANPTSRISLGDLDQQQVWNAIDRVNQGPLSPSELRSVLRPLLSAGRQRVKQIRVAYLGPPFS
ncbi:MAG: P-protein, partial [Planctomycetota bacterium]